MKYIRIIIEILVMSLLAWVLSIVPPINKVLKMFVPVVRPEIYLFTSLCFVYVMIKKICKYQKSYLPVIITYTILLILTMFVRKPYDSYMFSEEFYLFAWLKDMFSNIVIFVNIVGNLVFFIPLGYILANTIDKPKTLVILLGMGIIVILELLQLVTKLGVFDVVDIFLNSLGVIISVLFLKERRQKLDE